MGILADSLKSIFRKKARSVLTMLGVAIGVFSVVIISSIGDVGKDVINQELNSIGIDGVMIGVDSSKTSKTIGEEQLQLVQKNSVVKQSMPLMMKYSTVSAHGNSDQCVVFGVDKTVESMVSLDLLHGRMLNQADINGQETNCIVDESYAKNMYGRSNIVGKEILIQLNGVEQDFTVVGVVASGGNMLQGMMGEYIPCFLYAPITTIQKGYNAKGYDQIMIKLVNDSNDITQLQTELEQQLGEGNVSVQNLVQQKDKLNGILNTVTGVLALIGGISLLVSGISIMTVMMTSVQERKKEIGIKKAIGASKGRILCEFLSESFFICLFGSIIGIVIGIACVIAGCRLFGFSFFWNWKLLFTCLGFSCGIGMLFGVYPARRAADLNPVEALRSE